MEEETQNPVETAVLERERLKVCYKLIDEINYHLSDLKSFREIRSKMGVSNFKEVTNDGVDRIQKLSSSLNNVYPEIKEEE